jgi:hypothetical protein
MARRTTRPRSPDTGPAGAAREAERDAAIDAAARKLAARIPPLAEWQRERLRKLLDLSGGRDA